MACGTVSRAGARASRVIDGAKARNGRASNNTNNRRVSISTSTKRKNSNCSRGTTTTITTSVNNTKMQRMGRQTRTTCGSSNSSSNSRRSALLISASAAAALEPGTEIKKTSMLVVGSTGTLGRQVVRRALDEGYEVRCMVRPMRTSPADFLTEWGATIVYGDITKPETIAPTLVGIHTVVDCATSRPEENVMEVDWKGKVALMKACKAMGIERYIFYSIEKCEDHLEVPLMQVKHKSEKYLEQLDLNYTTLRLCGFMQALIGSYAVPILEDQQVWGTNDNTRTAYLDTQDIAKMTMAAITNDETVGMTLSLSGPRAFTIREVIALCERFAGAEAKVTTVPLWLLKGTRNVLKSFAWSSDAADRLAFAEVLNNSTVFAAPMDETYKVLKMSSSDVTSLEQYLQGYYSRILKRLKEVGGQSRQGDIYL